MANGKPASGSAAPLDDSADAALVWSPPAEDMTREGHGEVLRRLRNSAAGAGSWAAAVSAELQRGRLLGLNEADDAAAASDYGRMSPAEKRAWIGELFRQWHRQGLVPVDVRQAIAALEAERHRPAGKDLLQLPKPAAAPSVAKESASDNISD